MWACRGVGRSRPAALSLLRAALFLALWLAVTEAARGAAVRPLGLRRNAGVGSLAGEGGGEEGSSVREEPKGPRALFGWGRNNAGQLGLGHSNDVTSPEILNTFHAKQIKLIAVGGGSDSDRKAGGFSLVVTSNGLLYGFGANARGQLGVGDTEDRFAIVPVNLKTKSSVSKVAAGMAFAVAVTVDGRVYSWGANDHGQLGLGDTRDRSNPEIIAGALSNQQVVAVSCGVEHSVATTSAGVIFTWGSNKEGQLGLGSSLPRQLSPAKVQGAVTGIKFVAIDAGDNHVLAASNSGEVYCWGSNDYGQLGLGDLEDRNAPHALLHKFTRSKILRVAAGGRHSLAVTETGELFAWGSNDCGQLGMEVRGGRKYAGYPHRIESLKVSRIRAGASTSAAFIDSGRAFMWGCSNNGELGLNDVERRITPHVVPTPGGVNFGQLALGTSHVLGVNRAGELYGWGRNLNGQLGLAYASPTELRPQLVASPSSTDVAAVATGGFAYEYQGHTMAQTAAGKVFAWGWNAFGQLGLGTITPGSSIPNRVFELEKPLALRSMVCGQYNSAVLAKAGGGKGGRSKAAAPLALHTWGPNYNGQLGFHFNELGPVLSPQRVDALKGEALVEVAYGYAHALALTEEGVLHVWGANTFGQLGTGDSKERNKPTVVRAFRGEKVIHVAAGQHSSFAVTASGEVYAWGYNDNYELGLGQGTSRNSPQTVTALSGKNVTRVAAGGYHCLAGTGAGELFAWGSNRYGQLGLGHSREVTTPQRVVGLPTLAPTQHPSPLDRFRRNAGDGFGAAEGEGAVFTGVFDAGTWHSVAVVAGGRTFAWGRNNAGQLGMPKLHLGGVVEAPTEVEALSDSYAVAAVAAAAHTLAMAHPGPNWKS